MRSRSCCLTSRSFAPMRLRIVLRLTVNRPNLFFPLMCLKPRKSNVSGLPSPLRFRFCSANRPELNPARLIWMQFQSKHSQSFL